MGKRILILFVSVLIIISCVKKTDEKVPAEKSSKTEKKTETVKKNAAQTYIDIQKKNMDKAKESVEKQQKAQEDQIKELDNILGK